MTFHGDGYLTLKLPDVPPATGHIYSGFGFRSTQDVGLLYHKAFLVRAPPLPAAAVCVGLRGLEGGSTRPSLVH